jgi:hypothetical protein
LNPPLWTEIDFDIWLTKQQPTYWVVSRGRLVDPNDDSCTRTDTSCNEAGFDPGRVPPVVEDFTGELKCIEVDASGAPLSGNHLKGEATLIELGSGDASKYNAIGIIGNDGNNGDGVLCLGGQPGPDCPNGGEYNACPQTWILNHFADGAGDPFEGGDSSVHTTITVIPCAQNFETQIPESVTIQFAIINELENVFSTSTTITCWGSFDLGDIDPIFTRNSVGTTFVQTFMRPATGTNSGFLVVANQEHNDSGSISNAAANLHIVGERPGPDLIVIPAEQVQCGSPDNPCRP